MIEQAEIDKMIALATAGSVSERTTFLNDSGHTLVAQNDILAKITQAFTQTVHSTPKMSKVFQSSMGEDHVCERYLRRRPANFSPQNLQPSCSVVNNCQLHQLRLVVYTLNGAPSRESCWCGSKKASGACHKEHLCVQVGLSVLHSKPFDDEQTDAQQSL